MDAKAKNYILQQYINKIKVATAVAIIGMKPYGMTAETLVATMSECILKGSYYSWITKFSHNKPQIQEIALDLEFPFSGQGVVSSKANIGNQCRAVIPCIENMPSSSNSILQNITFADFLTSLYYLKNISPLNSLFVDATDLIIFISKHTQNILLYLKSAEGYQLPIRSVESAIRTIHSLHSSKYLMLCRNLTKISTLFIGVLISDILRSSEINVFCEQHRYSCLIQMIGHHECVVVEILAKLMKDIVDYHKYIVNEKSMNIYNLHPAILVDNLYFIFQSLYGVIYLSAETNEAKIHPLSLPTGIIEEWQTMITEITEHSHLNLSMFYVCLIEIHSIIFTIFKLCNFPSKI